MALLRPFVADLESFWSRSASPNPSTEFWRQPSLVVVRTNKLLVHFTLWSNCCTLFPCACGTVVFDDRCTRARW